YAPRGACGGVRGGPGGPIAEGCSEADSRHDARLTGGRVGRREGRAHRSIDLFGARVPEQSAPRARRGRRPSTSERNTRRSARPALVRSALLVAARQACALALTANPA